MKDPGTARCRRQLTSATVHRTAGGTFAGQSPGENPSALLGTTFCHDNQPYGAIYFVVESAELVAVPEDEGPRYGEVPSAAYICNRASNGWWDLRGTVTRGGVRSRLLEHTGVRSLVGQQYSIQSPPDAVEKGIHVTVAM